MKNVWGLLSVVVLMMTISPALNASGVHTGALYQGERTATLKGELIKVDSDSLTFTIKVDNGDQVQFQYNKDTTVEGSQSGIQGLSANTGTQLSVQYEEKSGKKVAVKIEVLK